MCGLVGIAGNTFQRDMKVFRDMLIFDQVRGFDSTGVAMVGVGKDPIVEKELDGPDNLWNFGDSKLFDTRGVSKIARRVAIGHNRAATVGKVVKENAHPFTFGHVTGCHNGSLEYWDELEKDDNDQRFDVDSKAIFQTIARKGIEHTWKSFYGAAALVWWDSEQETLNFIRNNERPLYMAYSANKDILLWASEDWMIRIAAARHNLTLAKFEGSYKNRDNQDIKYTYDTFSMRVDTHFAFKVTQNSVTMVEDRELEKKARPPIITRNYTAAVGGTNGGTSTGIKKDYPLDHKVNANWAKGHDKADATVRGLKFKLDRLINRYDGTGYQPYFIGTMQGGPCARIEVYPSTIAELRAFEKQNPPGVTNIYELLSRPRMQKSQGGALWSLRIAMDRVKLVSSITLPQEPTPPVQTPLVKEVVEAFNKMVEEEKEADNKVVQLYRTFLGKMVDEEEWRRRLKQAGGCCDFCGMGVALKEANHCTWVSDNSVICKDCTEDGTYQAYINQMGDAY